MRIFKKTVWVYHEEVKHASSENKNWNSFLSK